MPEGKERKGPSEIRLTAMDLARAAQSDSPVIISKYSKAWLLEDL